MGRRRHPRGDLAYPHQVIGVDTKGLPVLRHPNPSFEQLEQFGAVPDPYYKQAAGPRYGPHPRPARDQRG